MKFGKRLRATVESSYEEWRPMFMNYKDLKKCLKPTDPAGKDLESRDSDSKDHESDHNLDSHPESHDVPVSIADRKRHLHAVQEAERSSHQFFTCFRQQVDKVNDFFLDKQEDYIIEHRQLSERIAQCLVPGAPTREKVLRLKQRLISFHGELVLLENFSTVNYTGFRKILKKHDKKTGLNMRGIYLRTVLSTPFFLSDTVRKLVLSTEEQLAQLDRVQKFRRSSSSSPLSLDEPLGDEMQPPPTTIVDSAHDFSALLTNQNQALSSSRNGAEQGLSAIGTSSTPNAPSTTIQVPDVAVELPRPHAFISPRSPLWRLYAEGRAFGQLMREAITVTGASKRLPTLPQSIVDLVDAINPKELGLHSGFLSSVTQPSNYCIAGDENFSIGFFVFRPKVKLQIFRARQGGTFISKNLCGRAKLHVYETIANESTSTVPSENGIECEEPTEKFDFCVEQTRGAMTVGPWPAISCNSPDVHVEWMAETVCAIFYVRMPAFGAERMPGCDVRPLTPSRFRVAYDPEAGQEFTKIIC